MALMSQSMLAATHASPSSMHHFDQLDALRGVACGAVLLAHLKSVNQLSWMPDILGTAGVGVFFTLSGFLITRILLRERNSSRGLQDFYNRRVARIFPIYYLTLAVLAVIQPSKELAWCANFTFNLRFLASSYNYFCANPMDIETPPVAHFWSLCVEEHFYWVWPVVVIYCPLRVIRLVPWLIIFSTPMVCWKVNGFLDASNLIRPEIEGLVSRITITQLVAISIGCLIAFHEKSMLMPMRLGRHAIQRSCVIGAALCVFAIVVGSCVATLPRQVVDAFSGTLLHVFCGGAFLIALSATLLGRIRLLCRLGAISYGLYLYHLPVYAFYGLSTVGERASVKRGAAALLTTLVLAVISYRVIELPIQSWVRSTQRKGGAKGWLSPIGMVATIVVFAAFAKSLGGAYFSKAPDAMRNKMLANSVEAIVVGSSHAEYGIASPEFRMLTYNMGFESQDLWYDCEIATLLADRLPRMRLVIFSVSTFSLRLAQADIDREKWKESLYFNVWGIPSRNVNADSRRYGWFALANKGYYVDRMKSKAMLSDESDRGWLRNKSARLDKKSGRVAAERHRKASADRIEENKRKILQTIEFLQARGIEVIFVATPTNSCYRENTTDIQRSECFAFIGEMCNYKKLRCLDYSADTRFVDEDFFDCDHLNERGAIKFTRILDGDISSGNAE